VLLDRSVPNQDRLKTRFSKVGWKKPTEQWMQAGFVALFMLGIASTIIVLAKLK